MGRAFPVAAVVAAVLVTLLSTTFTAAEEITVGGGLGWTIPQSQNEYANWASSQSFNVGDVLVFNFGTSHTVAMVSKEAFDNCNIADAQPITNGPAKIILEEEGELFFICTITGHCDSGQKFGIMVTASDAAVPPSSDDALPPSSDDEADTPDVSPSPPPLELVPATPAPSPPQNKNGSPDGLHFQSLVLTLLAGSLAVALVMF